MNYSFLIFIFAILLIVILYNYFISVRNQLRRAKSGIDVALQQRYDMIPNLVACVKGYMKYEKHLIVEITEIRSKVLHDVLSREEIFNANASLGNLLGKLYGLIENNPKLLASESFENLQRSIVEVEERISASRRNYNAAVLRYNNTIEMIPYNLFAKLMGHKQQPFFKVNGN